jgi:phosphatidylcholine synthase
LRHPVAVGWLVHCFTGLGALCGMFGLMAVAEGHERAAILWLVVAMVLDGVDGPAARAWSVSEHVPRIDGYTLDLIIDYVTCIVIPVLFMHQFHMLPDDLSLVIGSFVLFVSALWMSRTDQMTDDHWFNGFPCEWNMIVPTLFLLHASPWTAAVACVLLTLTQITNWKFVHPMQVKRFRPVTVTVTILWMLMVLVLTWKHPGTNGFLRVVLLACPLYILALGSWRTLSPNAVPQPSA